MFEDISDITIEYEEDGVTVIEELDREIISRGGAWTTIMFRYRQWEPKNEAYGDDRYTIRRYRKMSGEYRQQSKFNISGRDQAKKIVDILTEWTGKD